MIHQGHEPNVLLKESKYNLKSFLISLPVCRAHSRLAHRSVSAVVTNPSNKMAIQHPVGKPNKQVIQT
jgi:hypothetical protein